MPRRKKEMSSEDEDDLFDGCKKHKPVQRNAANARERARMRVLSKAFVKLKTTLPWVPADTKLSKLDTLRLASSYIAHLRQVLTCGDEEEIAQPPVIHPLNLVRTFGRNESDLHVCSIITFFNVIREFILYTYQNISVFVVKQFTQVFI